jgi:hypothetical protein
MSLHMTNDDIRRVFSFRMDDEFEFDFDADADSDVNVNVNADSIRLRLDERARARFRRHQAQCGGRARMREHLLRNAFLRNRTDRLPDEVRCPVNFERMKHTIEMTPDFHS